MSQLTAYREKYNLRVPAFDGVYEVKFMFNGYDGPVQDVTGFGSTPVKITQEVDETLDNPFTTTLANFELLGTDAQDLRDLITADENQVLVEIHQVSPTPGLLYRLWVIPAEYTEMIQAGPRSVKFYASDKLGALEQFKMSDYYGTFEPVTLESVMDKVVKEYGLDFHFNDISGWSSSSVAYSESYLIKSELLSSAFYDGDSSISLLDAVKTQLIAPNCHLFQYQGELYMGQILFHGSPSPTLLRFRKEYTNRDTGTGTWTKTEPLRTIYSVPTDLIPVGNRMANRIVPPYKFVTRSYKSPTRNLLRNGSFEQDVVGNIGASGEWAYNNVTTCTVSDEQAKSGGIKSLKLTGVQPDSVGNIVSAINAESFEAKWILRNYIHQGDWGIDTLAEVGGTTTIGDASFNVFIDENDTVEAVDIHFAMYVVLGGGVLSWWNAETRRWVISSDVSASCIMTKTVNSMRSWETVSENIRFEKFSDEIHFVIFRPNFGTEPNIDMYVDKCELKVAPIEKGSGGITTDTSYFNISFKLSDSNSNGEFKQELQFLTTEGVDVMRKAIEGQILRNDDYSRPLFQWYYEDSTTKGIESLEVQSSYHLNQLLSRPISRYRFTARKNFSTQPGLIMSFSVDFNRYFEERRSMFGKFEWDLRASQIAVEGITMPVINSVEDPTDPVDPVVTITAQYLTSGTQPEGDSCNALYDGTQSFDLTGGGLRSNELEFAEANGVLDVIPVNGDYFYLKQGNFVREFTYSSAGDKFFPTTGSAITC